MASFEQHTRFGFIVGYFLSVYFLLNGIITSKLLTGLVLFSHFTGAFLPDLDSDSGKPFRIIFDLLGAIFALIAFFYCIEQLNGNFWAVLLLPAFTFFTFRYGVGEFFKTLTVHRGLFHSTPALLIATIGAYQFLELFSFNNKVRMILAISTGLGFFSHLILDAIYSSRNAKGVGHFFKIFGSCFKFYTKSLLFSILAWAIVVILIFFNFSFFELFYINFLQNFF